MKKLTLELEAFAVDSFAGRLHRRRRVLTNRRGTMDPKRRLELDVAIRTRDFAASAGRITPG